MRKRSATSRPFRFSRSRRAAFTLVETLVAAGVVAATGGILVSVLYSMATVSAKNISLNDSGTNLRRSATRITMDVEESVEITDVANFDPSNNTFTSVANGTWGNAVRIMTLLPGSFYVVDSASSSYTAAAPPATASGATTSYLPVGATTVYATFDPNSPAIAALKPLLTGTERLLPIYPIRRQPETATGALGLPLSGKPTLNASGKATFSLANALTAAPASSSSDANATIQQYNPAFLIRECAYVVIPNSDRTSCSLFYMDDTSVPAVRILRSQIIGATQPVDSYRPTNTPGGTGACFSLTKDTAGNQSLQILLPVSSRDYANALVRGGRSRAAYNFYITANISRRSLQGINTQ